ncbi:hypothetical protein [Planktotalea sp.]|uniref:hypothetical protein n=1 Tax=Planktotalea sp. TaxID=2029877 RepID=UPI003D6B7438
MIKPFAFCIAFLASPAFAEQSLVLSPCWDGIDKGASQTEAEMAKYLSGTWTMSAAGTGFTKGTNIMTGTLSADPASGALLMEGRALTPLDAANAPFDMSAAALSPNGLNETELEVLNGCANPARYFWEFGSGSRKSWGALMFVEGDLAVGFMANSAGGSRKILLTR